jgi:hypothetical protein
VDAQRPEAPEKQPSRAWEPALRWGLTALALLLVAVIALSFAVCVRTRQRALLQPDGTLVWHQDALYRASSVAVDTLSFAPPAPAPLPVVEWLGFGKPLTTSRPATQTCVVSETGSPLIFWPPFVTVLAACACWIGWWRRRRIGLCRSCGYDLRGLTPGVLCPECGKAPVVARG